MLEKSVRLAGTLASIVRPFVATIQGWLSRVTSTEQLHRIWRVVETAFLTFAWVNIWFISPVWTPILHRFICRSWHSINSAYELLMHGNGLQIAALAREIANLKGRLTFLWNSERARQERNLQRRDTVAPARRFAVELTVDPVYGSQHLFLLCTFLGGIVIGASCAVCSLCLGIWFGKNL